MKDYVIFTEVTSDLPADMAEDLKVQVLPMEFSFSDEERYRHYADAREMSLSDFYTRVRAGEEAITSQVMVSDFLEYFEPVLAAGKDILYVGFSTALSGSYNASLLAIEELQLKYPDAKIIAYSSLTASMGEGLLVYYAAQNQAAGMSLEDNHQWLQDHTQHIAHWFTVDDLHHLKRGGRVTPVAAFMGTMLNIKPLLHTNDEGKLIPREKIRTHKKVLERMVEIFDETVESPDGNPQIVFISHADNSEGAERLVNMLKDKPGVKDVVVSMISPIIGSHTGGGTIALFYHATHR